VRVRLSSRNDIPTKQLVYHTDRPRSTVIEHLKISPVYHECSLAYVYIDFEEQQFQSAKNLVACLLQQLLSKAPGIPENINELYNQNAKGETTLKMQQLMELLLEEVQQNPKTFIIIDALDEATESTRNAFLNVLLKLTPHVNLMITSRHSIESDLGSFKKSEELEIRANYQDIRNYIAATMAEDLQVSKLVRNDPVLYESITDKLTISAQGM